MTGEDIAILVFGAIIVLLCAFFYVKAGTWFDDRTDRKILRGSLVFFGLFGCLMVAGGLMGTSPGETLRLTATGIWGALTTEVQTKPSRPSDWVSMVAVLFVWMMTMVQMRVTFWRMLNKEIFLWVEKYRSAILLVAKYPSRPRFNTPPPLWEHERTDPTRSMRASIWFSDAVQTSFDTLLLGFSKARKLRDIRRQDRQTGQAV